MKNLIILLFSVSFYSFSFAQTIDKKNIIATLEDISNYEEYVVDKMTYRSEIILNTKLKKVTVKDSLNFGQGEYAVYITKFYLEDLQLNSMTYDYLETEKDKFMVNINLATKNKSVEYTIREVKKNQIIQMSKTTYSNEIKCFIANLRRLPMFLAEKYVENVKELLDLKESKRDNFFTK